MISADRRAALVVLGCLVVLGGCGAASGAPADPPSLGIAVDPGTVRVEGAACLAGTVEIVFVLDVDGPRRGAPKMTVAHVTPNAAGSWSTTYTVRRPGSLTIAADCLGSFEYRSEQVDVHPLIERPPRTAPVPGHPRYTG